LKVSEVRTPRWLVGAALLLGCTARLSGSDSGADVTSMPGLTPTAGAAGSSSTPPGDTPLDCSKTQVAFSPLRRLTREQFDNSIRDLLGIQGQPSLALSADEKLGTFYSNSAAPVTRLSIEQYRDVAESVAARLRSVILAVHHVVLRNPARSMRATRAVRS
jgi:hypothetical protein